jgi:hypothetical protein
LGAFGLHAEHPFLRFPLMLPSDRYLAELLGLTEEQFLYFKAEVERRAKEQPTPAVVAGTETIIALTLTAIGVGFQVVSALLKPSIPTQETGRPPQIQARNRTDSPVTNNQRYTPRYGFDSTQDITTLGSTIPIVYALRETVAGVTYGGVRVSTPMLWSQIYSLGGSQLLRAIFLIGEGPISTIDNRNFAAGGNTLASYDFGDPTANTVGSRLTVYSRINGNLDGRITSANRVFGRAASGDPGNGENNGGGDVFSVQQGSSWDSDFCSATRPNNQTIFGVYTLIGNDFGYKVNPVIRPRKQAQLIPFEDDGDAQVKCRIDDVAWAQRKKAQTYFSSRSGLVSGSVGSIGSQITYKLYPSSEKDTEFSRDLRQITNPSAWSIDIKQITKDTGGSIVKPALESNRAKSIFKYDNDTFIDIRGNLFVTVDDVRVDENGKGILIATFRFNTNPFTPQDNTDNVNDLLEVLKASKFRVTFTNPALGDDDDEFVTKYTVKIRVKTKTKQKLDRASVSANSTNVTIDGVSYTFLTAIGTGTSANIDINATNSIETPIFRMRDGTVVTGNGTIQVTKNLKFDATQIYVEKCGDVAGTVAGRQKTWDDAIIPGELYKIGSALAICNDRTDAAFVSDVDVSTGGGTEVTANFTTVRPGSVALNSQANIERDGKTYLDGNFELRNVATVDGHVLRCALASISTTRACQAVEFGIRSRLGIRINGMCNLRDAISFSDADDRACLSRQNDIIERGSTLKVDVFQSNTITTTEERYSFFKISYREAGDGGNYIELSNAYGIRGATQQNIFNYIQLVMPAVKQWEFQIEPLSGFEVRSGGVGTLYVLDSRLSSRVVINDGAITVAFNGESVANNAETFSIAAVRTGGKGIPQLDPVNYGDGTRSYLDTYGKLAEAFVYEEAQSSAASGPEHEVVYINEIVPNLLTPNYNNLALVGVNVLSSVEWQQFGQFSCYVTGGKTCRNLRNGLAVGPTHLFPDVLLDLMTNASYGTGDLITDEMIDIDSFTEAADWCASRRYYFDGVQADQVNLRQWATDTAAANLLLFGENDGKFYLRPALQFDAVPIKALFTAGNMVEGSFKLQYLEPEEREPIQVSVRYREERASTDLTNPGIFPTEREILVRESTGSALDPVEALDLSDFVTNRQQAIDTAKYIIRMRRLPTHVITFNTTHESALAKFGPSDYIRVAMDYTEYDEFNNGVVTEAGALVSTQELIGGNYTVIAWDGTANNAPAEQTLSVSDDGKFAEPRGIIFTVKKAASQIRTYQIERVVPQEDGSFSIEAVHMPTNTSGVLELADGFDTAGNWTIEG